MTALLAFLLAVPAQPSDPGFTFPPQRKGEIVASLALQVAEQGPAPGLGRVKLTLNVEGPAALEVEPPRLEDALAGWRVEGAASSLAENEGRAHWEETLRLVQVKPGVVPLPGVALRFRAGPGSAWEEASWPDLLLESRASPPPERLSPLPPSAWPGRLRLIGIVLGLAFALALLGRAGQRWLHRPPHPLPLHERTLAALRDTPADVAAAVTYIDAVVRGYLHERFGVEALRKTHQELLETPALQAVLSAEQQHLLAELLAACDMLKFAGVEGGADLQAVKRQATAFIRGTAPAGQGERVGKAAMPGDNRKDVQEG